jgi:lambda family phage portal protein
MNLIDKAIGFLNPKAGLERARYRTAMGILEEYDQKRAYDAASKGRRTDGWKATGTSANSELYYALDTLRNRSRELVRNNPYAKRIMKVVPNNVIGTGIRPTPMAENKNTSKKAKLLWKEWADKTACDFEGMHSMGGLQKLAMRAVIESGEVLILRRRTTSKLVPIELQVLEGDHIDSNKNGEGLPGGGYIMQGIEFNGKGKRVAIWMFSRHPGEQFRFPTDITSKRIPIEDVLHIYQVDRPGQVRGIPLMVSSMLRMKDFDDYEDAQLIRQKIAACFSVFVMDQQDSVFQGDAEAKEMAERVEPGIIEHLPPGKDVKFANPPGADGYADYSRKIQQGIAAGSGITYEAMTGDLSNVNFSSGRMGWIEMQREIEDWQWNTFIPQFCDKVWQWFNEAAIIAGSLRSSVPVTWTTPRRMMLDPVKETNAKISQIGAGLTTLTETLMEDGYDFDEVMEQKALENEKLKELGITLIGTMAPEPAEVKVLE